MKLYKYILTVAAAALTLNSCYDEKMEWGKPDDHGDVNIADIPLELAEKLANYDFIKNYAAQYMPGVTIGLGLGADLYIDDAEYRQVANDNFQMFTTGNAMKHDAVVSNSGAFNWTTIDKFFNAIPADMAVYGHTLLWHTQQRAMYLNSLISPDIIVEPDEGSIENILSNSGFEAGNIDGWGAWSSAGCTAEISQEKSYEGSYSMKLNNPVAGANYSAQAYYTLPTVNWEVGETYVYSAMVYSEEGNESFQMQLQSRVSYSGGAYQSDAIPAAKWTLFEKEFEMTQDVADKGITHMTIDFGAASGATYIDNIQFGKKKAEADPMLNIFENSDFENGTKDPWGSWGNNSTSSISEKGEGYNSDYAMVLYNPTDASTHSAQAGYTFDGMYLEKGAIYMIQFWAKSDSPAGKLQTQYQNGTTYGSQGAYSTFDVGTSWVLCEHEYEVAFDDVNRILINFGQVAGKYYIDNIKFGKKIEPVVTPPMLNIFENSDFETGTKDPWGSWGNNSTSSISEKGEGYKSDYAMVLYNPTDASTHSAQAGYTFDGTYLEMGATYMIQFWAKSDTPAGKLQTQYQNGSTYGSQGAYNTFDVGTSWVLCEHEYEVAFDDVNRILINFGEVGGTYYIDDIKFGKKLASPSSAPVRSAAPATRGIVIKEKTPEEKKAIITSAMKTWISTMIDHCKERVHMWDVLNEPIADNGQLRGVDFVPSEVGTNEFYWGQYVGKEYALKAFQFAREADPDATLFINDYNLETNPSKLSALIDYVKWIDEQNGSSIVDGIGTQMHLHAPSITRAEIDAMFKAMAATGKLVRVTELDVRMEYEAESPVSATVEQYARQAEVYQWVVESFKANVPAAQQSGITIWTLTDHAREHEYWLKNDVPNLFNANYARKHAYKGFCDGIAGRDISEDFDGSDWQSAYPDEE